jgi:ADP-dependent NAD(P)H-hydrate dehydratase / NAD(P)H-hydrate epimerase
MDTLPETVRAPEAEAKPPKKRRWRRVAIVALVTTLALGLGVGFGHRPLVRWWVIREARARGIELSFEDFSLSLDRVVLSAVRGRLVGVNGVDLQASELGIDIDGLDPKRIDARALAMTIEGPVDERLVALSTWADQHAQTLTLPATGDLVVRWGGKAAPWLTVVGRARSDGGGAGGLEGEVALEGMNLGLVAARWARKSPVAIGVGARSPEEAKLRIDLDTQARPIKATVKLVPMKLDDLARSRAIVLPEGLRGASAEAAATVFVGGPEAKGMYSGTATVDVTGWVPPHPRELDGIVFGRKTKLGATFEITPDLTEMRIGKATVEAGAFKLAGKGTVERKGLTAHARMNLDGTVPCSELGASAVDAHVGGIVGDFLKGVARVGLGGSVAVHVTIDADTRAIEKAKVEQSVDMGCRLRAPELR